MHKECQLEFVMHRTFLRCMFWCWRLFSVLVLTMLVVALFSAPESLLMEDGACAGSTSMTIQRSRRGDGQPTRVHYSLQGELNS